MKTYLFAAAGEEMFVERKFASPSGLGCVGRSRH